jgi:hypothetical protein
VSAADREALDNAISQVKAVTEDPKVGTVLTVRLQRY